MHEGSADVEAHDAALRAMEYLQTGAVRDKETVIRAFSSLDAAS
ncbi:MAG: hypothetical protein AAGD04_13550 [Pseudomonadota bacterium]